MVNKFVAHATAFNRASSSSPAGHSPLSVDDQLAAAKQRVQALEARMDKLEAALSVTASGDVELFAPGVLRLVGSTRVEIVGTQSVKLNDSVGNELKIDSSGISVTAAAKFKVSCSTYELSSGMSKVMAGMAEFSGVVKCETILANTVSGSTYTPGAGNVM